MTQLKNETEKAEKIKEKDKAEQAEKPKAESDEEPKTEPAEKKNKTSKE